ncbi:MAG: NAD-dependent protein deacylase [Phycisphaerae bacterium]|nr:NAD-dependent protein deacylase [Phycisphaerae bacterium]
MDDQIAQVADWLRSARSVVVLTGAGVSAESRIPTFREAASALAESGPDDMRALWAEFDPQTLATPEAFDADPEMVTRWYDWRRVMCLKAEPNPGHLALASIERELASRGGSFTLLTQNVDGLHRRAGSVKVVELHGSLFAWRGVRSGRPATLRDEPFERYPMTLNDGEIIRPGVVWFGEALPAVALERSFEALSSCDVFMSVGTSAVVHPAAGFIHEARRIGARTVEVNPDGTPISSVVDVALRGASGAVLPRLVG